MGTWFGEPKKRREEDDVAKVTIPPGNGKMRTDGLLDDRFRVVLATIYHGILISLTDLLPFKFQSSRTDIEAAEGMLHAAGIESTGLITLGVTREPHGHWDLH